MNTALPHSHNRGLHLSACALIIALLSACSTVQPPAAPAPTPQTPSASAPAPQAATPNPAPAPAPAPAATSSNRYYEEGHFSCEKGAGITLRTHPNHAGAVQLNIQNPAQNYTLTQVPSVSGAARFEDNKNGVVMLWLATKTMVLNERQGKLLADECQSPTQRNFKP